MVPSGGGGNWREVFGLLGPWPCRRLQDPNPFLLLSAPQWWCPPPAPPCATTIMCYLAVVLTNKVSWAWTAASQTASQHKLILRVYFLNHFVRVIETDSHTRMHVFWAHAGREEVTVLRGVAQEHATMEYQTAEFLPRRALELYTFYLKYIPSSASQHLTVFCLFLLLGSVKRSPMRTVL